MIRRGEQFYVGPIRVVVSSNVDGRCEVHLAFNDVNLTGATPALVEESRLEELRQEGSKLEATLNELDFLGWDKHRRALAKIKEPEGDI